MLAFRQGHPWVCRRPQIGHKMVTSLVLAVGVSVSSSASGNEQAFLINPT